MHNHIAEPLAKVLDEIMPPPAGQPTDAQVLDAMGRYGGSFVVALSLAARLADAYNRAKIKQTWPEYWETYSAFAREDMSKGATP